MAHIVGDLDMFVRDVFGVSLQIKLMSLLPDCLSFIWKVQEVGAPKEAPIADMLIAEECNAETVTEFLMVILKAVDVAKEAEDVTHIEHFPSSPLLLSSFCGVSLALMA